MRVAYICADPGVPAYGTKGCSLHIQEVLRVFVQRGDDVDLFAARVGGESPEDLESVRVHLIKPRTAANPVERETTLLEANGSFFSSLMATGPFDLIYERHALWAYAAAEYGRQTGATSLVEVNAPLVEEQATHRGLHNRDAAEAATRRCFQAASSIACVSQQVAEYAFRNGGSIERVLVVPNGVRTDRFSPRAGGPTVRDRFTIGFVGSLRPWHAAGDLLTAFACVKRRGPQDQTDLLLVGDGPLRSSLEEQANRLPAALQCHIHFAGRVDPETVPDWMSRFDVAVAPYAADGQCYFSPLKVFEYFAAGLPVIAARTGQLEELIDDGVTGLLYRPGDVPDLVEKLELLRNDRELASRIGAAARVEAVAKHGWEQRVESMLDAAGGLSLAAGDR